MKIFKLGKINYVIFIVKSWSIGNSSIALGTIYSLVILILGYLMTINLNSDLKICIVILSGVVGFFATSFYTKCTQNKDPQEVVIDGVLR